jgi:hypothetical protein
MMLVMLMQPHTPSNNADGLPSPLQIASHLNRLTSDLEAFAHPALDALTSRVTAHNLERVRRIKSRLVRLTTRVETVRGREIGILQHASEQPNAG